MQSTITALAELLGQQPTQGLRRSQNAALSSCPSSKPSSSAPRLEGVSPLAWPQHKGKDQVPCLGAQTRVGARGEVGQEGPQLPGSHPRASLSSGAGGSSLHCPSFLRSSQALSPSVGVRATREGASLLCGSMLGAGCWVRAVPGPLGCYSRGRQREDKETATGWATRAALPTVHLSAVPGGHPENIVLNDSLEPSNMAALGKATP